MLLCSHSHNNVSPRTSAERIRGNGYVQLRFVVGWGGGRDVMITYNILLSILILFYLCLILFVDSFSFWVVFHLWSVSAFIYLFIV